MGGSIAAPDNTAVRTDTDKSLKREELTPSDPFSEITLGAGSNQTIDFQAERRLGREVPLPTEPSAQIDSTLAAEASIGDNIRTFAEQRERGQVNLGLRDTGVSKIAELLHRTALADLSDSGWRRVDDPGWLAEFVPHNDNPNFCMKVTDQVSDDQEVV